MNAMSRMSPPHPGHSSGNSSPTRAMSLAQAIREVSRERGWSHESQRSPLACSPAACPLAACPSVAASRRLPTFPFVMRRDGRPELVIRGEHPVIAMPVLPRRRHEVREPVQKIKWRELDDAVGTHRARPHPFQGLRQPAEASQRSALYCVASSSENPFKPHPGDKDSLTRHGSGFGEGVSREWPPLSTGCRLLTCRT
jgi:hypothetical protein